MGLPSNLVGLIALVAPALWVLFRTIEPYERKLTERKLYLSFLGGVPLAVVAFALEWLGNLRLEIRTEGFLGLVAQPLIHTMIIVMALNHPRMRVHRENGFYGASLGLAFGATHGLLFLMAQGSSWLTLADLPLLLPALLGLTLFLGSHGAFLAHHTHARRRMTFVARAWAAYAGFTLLRWFQYYAGESRTAEGIWLGLTGYIIKVLLGLLLLGLGAWAYHYRYHQLLRPVFMRRRKRRYRRRRASKASKG